MQPSIWTTTLRSTLRLFKPCLKIKVTSLTDWYANIIKERKETLCSISKYLVADAWFSKKPFVDQIIEMDMHLISRLRDDADLKYLYLAFNREEGTTM
ncbi:transposase [Tangfeifania diversioriginum]|uniref:transposase n=1 Tax=Tangfeifania diversioriginum TaxID=1168035 RepID=UPI001114707A|nr:transposase [Tangfeifania diversioriginum]